MHFQLKFKVDNIRAKDTTLCINLNIDDTPITSPAHTHPSHSQTSRLLSTRIHVCAVALEVLNAPAQPEDQVYRALLLHVVGFQRIAVVPLFSNEFEALLIRRYPSLSWTLLFTMSMVSDDSTSRVLGSSSLSWTVSPVFY